MNIQSIKAFLNYDDKPITKKWFINSAIISGIILYLGTYYSDNALVNFIFCSVINILAIILYVYIVKRVTLDSKNKNLYAGIYFCEISFSLNYLAYAFWVSGWDHAFIIICIQATCSIITIISLYLYCVNGVKNQKFINKTKDSSTSIRNVGIFCGIIGLLVSKMLPVWISGAFGAIIVGTAFLYGIIFIMKYKYYIQLEKIEKLEQIN